MESEVHTNKVPFFCYRYAYAPSADSLRDYEPGQDYLVFRVFENHFIFAACDGVSQSFYGNLAAQFLGDELVTWLFKEMPSTFDQTILKNSLNTFLSDLTTVATRQIDEHPIPNEPALLHEVLVDKKARGSETMFVCGRLDQPGTKFPGGRIILAWMGDMRVNLWRYGGPVNLDGSHETNQRWSTHGGPIGGLINLYVAPLFLAENEFTRLVVYSDGLSVLDSLLGKELLDDNSLQQMIWDTKTRPDSDDVTYFELYRDRSKPVAQPGEGATSTPAVRPITLQTETQTAMPLAAAAMMLTETPRTIAMEAPALIQLP
jgi:hypothetical protein